MKITLASQSPRRLEILQAAGFQVCVAPSDIDESPQAGEDPIMMVRRLAAEKARVCLQNNDAIIAADTLVLLNQQVMGKPENREEARSMLTALSANTHQVLTGVCVRHHGESATEVVSTMVEFSALSPDVINTYLDHNPYQDKAGAYAIQEGAASFVISVQGSLDNVIGLPMATVHHLLELTHEAHA